MARIRSIKPDLFASYSIANLPIDARYLFIGMFTEADDYGRLIDSPKKIAGAVFPHDEDIDTAIVDGLLDTLVKNGHIVRYVIGGKKYIAIPRWNDHQKVAHKTESRIPEPPRGLVLDDPEQAPF